MFTPNRSRQRDPRTASNTAAIVVDGREIAVECRPNARAKRFIMRVAKSGTGVRITVPPGHGLDEALDFADKNRGWIASQLGKTPAAVAFEPGAIIPFRGAAYAIEHVPGRRGTVSIRPSENGGPPVIAVAGDAPHVGRRLRDWMKREARAALSARCAEHAAVLDLRYRRIQIRDQISRWGSCSSSGVLSFSWRLILAPDTVLDYVAAHEVAHLREMNHGPRFWALVKQAYPETDRARAWLRRNGPDLHRYGV